jgi:uncharacterized iron-regulated membrane protein
MTPAAAVPPRPSRQYRPWPRRSLVRDICVWTHRYCGLTMAAFLFVAGLTGSILAFNSELDHFFAPQLFSAPKPGAAPLDFATLCERAAPLVPHGRVLGVRYTEADRVYVAFAPLTNPATDRPYNLGFTEFYIDPWTGNETGRRIRGDLSQGRINLMPFLYDVHWRLAAGNAGQWIMGVVAVVWTLDCFVAFYLTLPRGRGGFLRRWQYAWRVKWRASAFRVNFDLHRAGGLWVWPLLFIFAWSSVMMNIRPWYEKVMLALFDYERPMVRYLVNARRNEHPRLDWHRALAVGERLMAEQSRLRGFAVGQPLAFAYSPPTARTPTRCGAAATCSNARRRAAARA